MGDAAIHPLHAILRVAFRHAVRAPDAEAACAQVQALAAEPLTVAQFHAAIADCLARRLIHDPIRLTEHSLQCHWRLELTPEGVAVARTLAEQD